MPEPTTATAVATVLAASTTVPMLELFGVSVGVRPDVLIAGFAGALVAIVLLDSVPSAGDTWRNLLDSTVKRIFVSLASSIVAGYLTPQLLLISNLPDTLLLGLAFTIGAGAQNFLRSAVDRFSMARGPITNEKGGPKP